MHKIVIHWWLFCIIFLIGCQVDDHGVIAPNIILINVDDIGFGDFEPYGQELIKTPHIAKMAREGALFTNFYAGSTVCGPSRAALLTGLHTGHLRDCGNGQDSLSFHFQTWPKLLQDNGYVTGMFGKQHGALLDSTSVLGDSPLDRGFDSFVGWLNAGDAHQHFIDGKTNGWDRRDYLFKSTSEGHFIPHFIAPDHYVQNEFLHHGTEFIKTHRDTSFFLYLPFTIGHAELAVPKPDDSDYDDVVHKDIWEQYIDDDGESIFPEFDYQGDDIYARPIPFKSRATYAAMLSYLDSNIGELLELLRVLNLENNTLVLLTSDNGPADEGGIDAIQIDGHLDSPFNSSGGLRGFKRSLHDGGIRVPMIAWWPGSITPQIRIDDFFANYDIGPTLLDLTKTEPLSRSDGISFLPALIDQRQEELHEFLYWEWNNNQAVRFQNWKAVRKTNESYTDKVELYNLSIDPGESKDVSLRSEHHEILRNAKIYLNQENAGTACDFIPLIL